MFELKGESLIPGSTEAELANSRLPLPDRDSLSEEDRRAYDYVVDRSKRFFASVPANAGQEYRMTPLFQGLLQSPRLAELWARFGDFYQPAETRGSFTSRERELAELSLGPVLAKQTRSPLHLAAIHVADGVGVGIEPLHIKAIIEGRLDELDPEDRQLVEYVQATAWGTLNRELFDGLAARMGDRNAIEYTSYITYRIGNLRTISAMWAILGKPRDPSKGLELLQAYIDGQAEPHPKDRGYNWIETPAGGVQSP